jgi:glycosyltransferase involved in cell wall biosynthesis/GT2 family glycosyltransferase
VVNGPSTDETAGLLEEYGGRIKRVDCRSRNLSESRNLGIAAAAGEVVVFIDDDALPADTRWLARYAQAFQSPESARAGAFGGPVLQHDTEWYEFSGGMTSDYAFQIFRYEPDAESRWRDQTWFRGVYGCNCAFRRSALVQVGGFDEHYVYYLDETDVCVRLARAGWSTGYLPDNPVRHYSTRASDPTAPVERRWDVIARSDTYYALKNGAHRLPRRALNTLRYAPRKHYVTDINDALLNGVISARLWARQVRRLLSGVAQGMRDGLLRRRRLGRFGAAPAFAPFGRRLTDRPLRLALLTQSVPGQPGYGGIARYTFDLACALHDLGHHVHIICRGDRPAHHERLGFVIHSIPEQTCRLDPGLAGRPVVQRNLAYALAVVEKLKELEASDFHFDVVHASNWDAEAAALIRAQLYPTVLLLVSPLAQVILSERWPLSDDLRAAVALDRWQILHADTVCSPSQGLLHSYQHLMALPPHLLPHLHLTPLGILPSRAEPLPPDPARPRLLFVGRCERRKGLHILLQTLPLLLSAFPKWECHLVGNDQIPLPEGGSLKDHFLARHQAAPWLARVHFHGAVDEPTLQRHYRACDLFVAPSLFESFGLIYHEAMQYAKPVVGCRTGGVPEVVADGVEGLLVEPGDADALREALERLMGDRELRERMGQAGARRVREQANHRTMAAALERVYRETAERVGEERAARRARLAAHDLPLFDPSPHLAFSGHWEAKEDPQGRRYQVGWAHARLVFKANGGGLLWLVLLRNPWSGILEVGVNGSVWARFDLYKPGAPEPDYVVTCQLPHAAGQLTVSLTVLPERNLESQAFDIWINHLRIL